MEYTWKSIPQEKKPQKKSAITFSIIKHYIVEKLRLLIWNKRLLIICASIVVVLWGIVAWWNFMPEKSRSDIVSKVTSILWLQTETLQFLTQASPTAYADNLWICTATGIWQKHTPNVLTSMPQWYNDTILYYIGNIVYSTITPSNTNCIPQQQPWWTCELYVCVPTNTLWTTIPNQAISWATLCQQGAAIWDQCQLTTSTWIAQPWICLWVTAQGQFCKDTTSWKCMWVQWSCGSPADGCGSRHEWTYYDGTLQQNDPDLCEQGTIIPGSWESASPPDGWTWRCETTSWPIVSPNLPVNQVECRADVAYCGDEVKNGNEECDYKNPNTPNCTTECTFAECWNGEIEYGEECDDENNVSGDGCSATCKIEWPNECLEENLRMKWALEIENWERVVYWKYQQNNNNNTIWHFKEYDVPTNLDCVGMRDLVAQAFCAEKYDSTYFDASWLTYSAQDCTLWSTNPYRELEMQWSIKCCNDTVCDDDADGTPPDPEIQTCDYPYVWNADSIASCTIGVQVCDDNEFGVCIPENQYYWIIEECGNNLDDDCDGEVDESWILWYADTDGDGYGNPNTVINSCDQPDDYVDNDDDCNDDNANINPWAVDICNDEIDQDCQWWDAICTGKVTCYEDQDNDGYGAWSATVFDADICPDGRVINNTDCNDNPSNGTDVHAYITCQQVSSSDICEDVQVCALTCPELPIEWTDPTCNDGVDNDCDGYIDGSDNSCEVCQWSIPDHASACSADGAYAGSTTQYRTQTDSCSDDVCEFICDINYEWENGECVLINDQCEDIYCPNPGDPGENCSLVPAEIDSNGCTIECASIVCDCVDIDNDNICDEEDDCIDIDEDGVCDDEDCDDSDADIYPGAEEVCDDNEDNDCDGDIDEDDNECSHNSGGTTWWDNYCGDGRVRSTEECDDGNSRSGDGCSSNCKIEDDDYDDDEQDTKEVFADYLSDALNRLEKACDYDDYNYQDIMFRDVEWDPDNEAVNTLLAYCIVKWYDRTRNTQYHTDAATSKAEAIKVLSKLDAMWYSVPFDEKWYVRGSLPYKDMKPNAWYTTYVMYAHAEWLLDGIGNSKLIGTELKALTPIKKSEMRELLRNAWVDKEYRELEWFGQYIYRDDMANIMVDAFQDKLKDYQYLYGNNIKLYTMMVQKLNSMSPSKQLSYVRGLVKKLEKLDHRMMWENFNLHLRGMIEFLENILEQVE